MKKFTLLRRHLAAMLTCCGMGLCAPTVSLAADFVAGVDDSSNIYYAASNGDTTFGSLTQIGYLGGTYSRGIVINDFDNDGDLDLVAGRGISSTAWFYLFTNDGSDSFTKSAMVGTLSNANSYAMEMATGDFNNDGNQDFVANGNYWNTGIYLGDGNGGFTKTELNLGNYGRGMDVADFNGDGNLDFARANYSNGYIYIHPGNGDGTFAAAVYVGDTGSDPYGLVAGDFNNDGRADLIVNDGGGGDPYFFAGNGDGTFAAPVYIPSLDLNNHGGYDAYDFNGDGNLDVVASNYTGRQMFCFPGNGDGTFGAAVVIGTAATSLMAVSAMPIGPPAGTPTAVLTPASATIASGGSVDFDGSASSDPDGSLTAYSWTFGDGGSDTGADPAAHTYAAEGIYTARLTVQDDDSPAKSDTAHTTVTVQGATPAVITTPVSYGEAAADNGVWPLTLNGADYAGDSEGLVSHTWNLDDGLGEDFEDGNDDGWNRYAGTWAINSAAPLAGAHSYQQTNASADRTWNLFSKEFTGDLVIEADVRFLAGSGEEAQILFRARNEKNNYEMIIRGRGNNDVLLYQRVNDSTTNLFEYDLAGDPRFTAPSYPIDLGHTYHAKIVCQGALISIYLDGFLLFTYSDGSFMDGRVGLSTYRTDTLFDNLTVTTTGRGQLVPHTFTAGTYNVALTVADAAGQTATDTVPLTMQPGNAPLADGGGPYSADESQAVAGGWLFTLDGTGSSDDVEIQKYVWDFGSDTFDGTAFGAGKWYTNSLLGISQNDGVAVTGANGWDNRYLVSANTYPKVMGQVFEATVTASAGGQCMFGFKNASTTNFHYNQFPYEFYISSGNIYIYENSNSRGYTGYNIAYNIPYDFRIELTGSGAVYSYRPAGGVWAVIYRSAYTTADTELRKGIVVYSSTYTFDNFRETTAGSNPSIRLFPGGAGPISGELTVVDRAGQTDTASVSLTAVAGDPPAAAAGADQSLGEPQASDGVWVVSFDATGSSDTNGIYTYEWDWAYDGSFDPSGDTGPTPSHSWNAPGTYTVAVRVTDHALQSHIDTMTVTITIGNPPTADAGGPYAVDEFSGNAAEGGFTVTLDGTGSSDAESAIERYFWDLGTDTFAGTAIQDGKWYHHAGVSQNDHISVPATVGSTWGNNYLFSKDTYSRGDGLALEAKIRHTGSHAMFGFKNTNTTNFSYNQMPYAIYFYGTSLYVYEDGASRGSTGFTFSYNTWYDVRIELKPTAGARYYYRLSGNPDWILIYDSGYGTATDFRRGVDVYSGTFDLDDLREYAAGSSPTCRFYGLGSRTITLTVRDHVGQPDSDTSSVTLSANDPPVAAAGADQSQNETDGFFGSWTFTFDGSGSSDDNGVYTYEWDWDYDGSFDPADTGVNASHVYTTPGTHTVALRVSDHALQSHIDTATATITTGNPPTADAGADRTTEGIWPVTLNGAASTDDNGIVKYEWNFGDGHSGVGATPSHSYWTPGVYTATLTVYDQALQTGTDTVTVTVLAADGTPTANAGGPFSAGVDGPPAYFNASASTDDHGIVKYLWDIDAAVDSDGDGNFTNDVDVVGKKPFHTYTAAGVYTVTLTVVDGANQSATATATVTVADNLAPDVICVPWNGNDPTVPHETYNGRAVTLKAIVRDAGNLTYQWNFGDGTPLSPAAPAAVTNKYAIEATHTYPVSPDGTPYTATLTVWDSNGLVGQDNYYVVVRANSLDSRTNIAIDNGLWWIHKNQNKSDGHWASYGSYYGSPTGSSIQSFEINGHLQTGDNQEDPYVETVDRGFAYLFTTLSAGAPSTASYKTHGNPDSNGNNLVIGVNSGYPIYEGGMVMDAIASSNTPLALATTGPANVKGRYYYDILTDMVDMYAYGQVDANWDRGGWRYSWHSSADNSACQWAAIGMLAAEDNFGINVPQFVKDENNLYWLQYSYDGTGFGYTGPGNGVATTPSGMVQLAFDDVFTTDTRWRSAEDYIANHWFWQNGNYYGMYALVKALKLARPYPVVNLAATGLDWYNDPNSGVRDWLVDHQSTDGGWPDYYGRTFASAWSIIMLTPTLFQQPPVADAGADIIWAYDLELTFDGSGSSHTDPGRHIVKYEWDFDGNGTWDFTTSDPGDPGAVFTYPDPDPANQGTAPTVYTARLRVTDDNEPPQTDIDTREVTVAEPPHAPFARAGGPYRATVGIPFTLDGSGSFDIDAGDSVTTYEWDLDSDGVWFDDIDLTTGNATAPHTYNSQGVYAIGLRVRDYGAFDPLGCTPGVDCTPSVSQPSYTSVTVEINQPPTADAGGPYTVDEGAPLVLDGSGSADPNGDPLSYAWDLDNDTVYDDATGAGPSTSFADNGTYTIGLEVSDSLLTDTATATVTVNDLAPTAAVVGPATLDEGQNGTFSGSGSTSSPDAIVLYEWDLDNDGVYDDATGMNISHSWGANGSYTIGLRVTDDDGSTATAGFTVTVNDLGPSAVLPGPSSLNEGQDGTFDGGGSSSAPDAIVQYEWDWNYDGSFDPSGDTGISVNHSWTDNGVFTVALRVTDEDGSSDIATLTVTVANVVPAAAAGVDQTADEGSAVAFGGSFTDPGAADTHTYHWDFGDGTTQSGFLNVSHVYADNGTYTVTLTITDDDGGVDSDSLTVTIGNVAPAVDAGPDQTVNQGDSVTFAGSFTDPGSADGHTYAWDFGDGSAVDTTTLTPTHVYALAGDYTVTLTVTDDDGGVTIATLTVHVLFVSSNVDAGVNQTTGEGDTVHFSGAYTDSGNGPYSAAWDFGDGGSDNSGSLTPSHVFTDNGVYTVTLTVTDSLGTAESDSLQVTVNNVAPTVDAGPDQTVNVGDSVHFAGAFTDPGSADTHTILWDFADGHTATATLTPTHVFAVAGNYLVALQVTDDDGGVTSDTLIVTVNSPAMNVDAGTDQSANEGGTVSFTGSFTDNGKGPFTIAWDFGDGGGSGGSLTPVHVYADNGVYTVTLTVTDSLGNTESDTMTVTVHNVAPAVDAGADMTIILGDIATFSGAFTDPGTADTHTVLWDFGDGTSAAATLTPIRFYGAVGTYTVTLTVTDGDGGVGNDTLVVTVEPPAPSICGDIDGDGDVDAADRSALLASYRRCQGSPGYNPAADLDGDNCVTLADYRQWFLCYQAYSTP